MRAVIQRVSEARVRVEGREVAGIGRGVVVLLGVARGDTSEDVEAMVEKVADLRMFEDAAGKMNLSARDVAAEILVVSQFTLYGDCRRGRRPSFLEAAPLALAKERYEAVVAGLQAQGFRVRTGEFRATMTVSLSNEGPVTLLLDSRGQF